MPLPHPGYGTHAADPDEFWRRRGLLPPHARKWVNGRCVEDPAIPPWLPLSQRPEGWWRDLDAPHVWWCLCGRCGPGGEAERATPPSEDEARRWFEWAASRQTLEDARRDAFSSRRS